MTRGCTDNLNRRINISNDGLECASRTYFKHPFGGIGLRRTGMGAILLEIVGKTRGIVTQFAEVPGKMVQINMRLEGFKS